MVLKTRKMMSEDAHDLALTALLSVARDLAPQVPEELIRKIYAIQSRHQFDDDPAIRVEEMRRLIEEAAEKAPTDGKGTPG
jgi:hypothetical protein